MFNKVLEIGLLVFIWLVVVTLVFFIGAGLFTDWQSGLWRAG